MAEETRKPKIEYKILFTHAILNIYFFTIVNNLNLQGLRKRQKLEDVNYCHRKLHLRFGRRPKSVKNSDILPFSNALETSKKVPHSSAFFFFYKVA